MISRDIYSEGNHYRVIWYDDSGKSLLDMKVVLGDGEEIETIANAIWDQMQNPVPMTEPNPFDYMTVAEYLAYRQNEVNAHRESIINGGYTWNGSVFDSDERARQNVTSVSTAVLAGAQLPANFSWRNKFNVNIPMTGMEVVQFGMAMLDWVSRVYGTSWFHKDTLEDMATDPALTDDQRKTAIRDHDITLGWPAV